MRSVLTALRVTGVAVALTALSAVTAPVAFAEEPKHGSVSVDPNPAEPGAQVKLRVRGCDDDWAIAQSSVFVSEVRLSTGRDDRRTLWGDALIRSWAEPGRHDIRVKCGGHGDREWGSIEIERRREHHPNPHHTPIWPVHAGGGGMAEELAAKSKAVDVAKAADRAGSGARAQAAGAAPAAAAKKSHDDDGPGLPHTLIGAVLAAAATLAVAGRALTLRRRRSGQ
ncbi:hypothetical protein ACFWCB_10515 [Streptomyces sp. NPDC060048]|uniref:hypothetical protein n=1 Tax=unclassified Streptomyces TaxID=2593676 RepID=UPI00367DEE3A